VSELSTSCLVFVLIKREGILEDRLASLSGSVDYKAKKSKAWWVEKLQKQGYSSQNMRDDMRAANNWPSGRGSKNVHALYGKLTGKEVEDILAE
jgi:hypothetical protein